MRNGVGGWSLGLVWVEHGRMVRIQNVSVYVVIIIVILCALACTQQL